MQWKNQASPKEQDLCWFKKEVAFSPIQVETKALPLAIRIATEEDWSRVLLLTDCKLLHDSINCRLDPPWEVKWISRKKNLVARAIAKSGMN